MEGVVSPAARAGTSADYDRKFSIISVISGITVIFL